MDRSLKLSPHVPLALACLLSLSAIPPVLAKSASKPIRKTALSRKAPAAKPAASKPAAPSVIDAELRAAMKSAPKATDYPKENYVQLLDIGTVTVKRDGTEVEEYRTTYKLFNKRARDLGEVSLPFNSSYQKLEVVQARTISKSGRVRDLNRKEIRTASPFTEYPLYDDSMYVGFSLPGIEDESVIDYTYRIVSKPIFMKGHFSQRWGFNSTLPISESRFTLNVPANKPIEFRMYNGDAVKSSVTTSKDGATKSHVWRLNQIKPLEVEPYMPPMHEVSTWMEVSTIASWEEISQWFWGLSKPQIAANAGIRSTVNTLIKGKNTDEEKAQALHEWVANKVRYVGLEFGLSAYKPHAAGEAYDKLYGDCKDKAILLITMLDLAGIKAHPVLVSASNGDLIKKTLPSIDAFDHCVVQAEVGGKTVWLDPTDESNEYGSMPSSVRDTTLLVVRNGVGELVTIPDYSAEDNQADARVKVTLLPENGADAEAELIMPAGAAESMRYALKELTEEQKKEVAERMVPDFLPGAKLKTFQFPDPKEKNGPFVMKLAFTSTGWGTKAGNMLIFPVGLAAGGREGRNPNNKETRVWPLVIDTAFKTRSEAAITLPEGYKVEEAPKDLTLNGPLSQYERKIVRSEDGKTLTVSVTYAGQAGRIPADDYKKVKAYYDDVLKANDEQIILRKV